jgi:hypothetical protein
MKIRAIKGVESVLSEGIPPKCFADGLAMTILQGQSPFMRLICTTPIRGLRLLAVGAILCVLSLLPSCKPNDNGGSGQCRIAHIAELSGASFRTDYYFTYDDQNRLTSLVSSGGDSIEHRYSYIGTNTVLIRTTDSGRFLRHDSLLLDGNGRVINRRSFSNESGTDYENHSYSYGPTGNVMEEVYSTSTGAPAVVTAYTTSDEGNITSSTQGVTYGYHTDQAYRDGDFWQVMQLLRDGYVIFKSKHMLANIRQGNVYQNINYTYDAAGRTNVLTYNENTNTFLLRFDHTCF